MLGPARAVGVAALGTAGALAGQTVAALGPADDHPRAGGGLTRVAFAVQLDDHVGAQGGVFLVAADPLVKLRRRPRPRRERIGVEGDNTGSSGGVAGRPVRWRVASMAPCRTAWGLRVGMPSPWRVKALRSDGHVVSSSFAAALTLPSLSANARRARPRRGRPGSGWAASPVVTIVPAPYSAPHSAMSECCRRRTSSSTPPPRGCRCGRQPEPEDAPQHGGAWAG
jgi:hypothetical protein